MSMIRTCQRCGAAIPWYTPGAVVSVEDRGTRTVLEWRLCDACGNRFATGALSSWIHGKGRCSKCGDSPGAHVISVSLKDSAHSWHVCGFCADEVAATAAEQWTLPGCVTDDGTAEQIAPKPEPAANNPFAGAFTAIEQAATAKGMPTYAGGWVPENAAEHPELWETVRKRYAPEDLTPAKWAWAIAASRTPGMPLL